MFYGKTYVQPCFFVFLEEKKKRRRAGVAIFFSGAVRRAGRFF